MKCKNCGYHLIMIKGKWLHYSEYKYNDKTGCLNPEPETKPNWSELEK